MKRQVYVPFSMMKDGNIPQEAVSLSKDTQLPVMTGQEEDGFGEIIAVVNIPETVALNYKESVKYGFIQVFDYTNEYVDLGHNTCLIVNSPRGKKINITPKVREKHILRYRHRFYEEGKHFFIIQQDDKFILTEGEFVVV